MASPNAFRFNEASTLVTINAKGQSSLCSGLLFHGAPGPIRTADTRFRRAVLCPLSYGGVDGYSSTPGILP